MDDTPSPNRGRIGIKIGLLFCLALLVWLWRPLFHSFIYSAFYSVPGFLTFVIPALFAIGLFLFPPLKSDSVDSSMEGKLGVLGTVFVIVLLVSMLYSVPGSMVKNEDIAQTTMADAEVVNSLPEANASNPRVIPRGVADVQTRGSVSYRQHKLGTSDIARAPSGRLAWSYAIRPDPFMVQVRGNQRGVLLSDMTRMENRQLSAYDEQDFKHGQGMLFHRSANWHLKKSDFWVQYHDDPIEFVHDGTAYMAYPKTGHEWKLAPIPHTVPTWEGVALVHPDGTIQHLSPEEAQQSEILDGQRLYPLYNARVRADSLGYRNGIINQMPLIGTFEGVVEVAGLPDNAGNEQPFVIDTDNSGMSYVMAMEPHGEDTRGLDEVWFYDADTGQMKYYPANNQTLLGPERAMGLVRSADSQTNWATADEPSGSSFRVVEPVFVVIDGDPWWHMKVVPVDNTDVARNVFVNAETGNTVSLTSTEAIQQFMRGKNVSGAQNASSTPTTQSQPTGDVYVVVRDENGTVVDTIPVGPGSEVSIVRNATNAS